jgi:hypothetical protein
VYEFNACVPYAGVTPVGAGEGFELEGAALVALLALLPPGDEGAQAAGAQQPLAPDDVKQVCVDAGAEPRRAQCVLWCVDGQWAAAHARVDPTSV